MAKFKCSASYSQHRYAHVRYVKWTWQLSGDLTCSFPSFAPVVRRLLFYVVSTQTSPSVVHFRTSRCQTYWWDSGRRAARMCLQNQLRTTYACSGWRKRTGVVATVVMRTEQKKLHDYVWCYSIHTSVWIHCWFNRAAHRRWLCVTIFSIHFLATKTDPSTQKQRLQSVIRWSFQQRLPCQANSVFSHSFNVVVAQISNLKRGGDHTNIGRKHGCGNSVISLLRVQSLSWQVTFMSGLLKQGMMSDQWKLNRLAGLQRHLAADTGNQTMGRSTV